jgi:hypothetical protein
LEFRWTLEVPQGSQAALENSTQNRTSFVPDVGGVYRVNLEVDDGRNKAQLEAVLEIEVTVAPNEPPIANAGNPQRTAPNAKVMLDGRGSIDPDGSNDRLSYMWSITKKPDGSNPTLTKDNEAVAEFTPDLVGEYQIALVVTDERGAESVPAATRVTAIEGFDRDPELTSVTPNEGTTEAVVNVTLRGKGFSSGARLDFGVRRIETRYVSETELTAQIDLRGITEGKYELRIININNKSSQAVEFTVKDIPTPTVTSLLPNKFGEGQKGDIALEGTGFLPSSEILFETTPLPTTLAAPNRLTAPIDLQGLSVGKYKIYVTNPGGRRSAGVDLEIVQLGPPPQITLLNPPFATTGAKLPFSAHGVGFEPDVKLIFNDKEIPSTRPRRDEVQANPELDLTGIAPGEYDVFVRNPDGQESNKIKFNVEDTDPTPILDRVLPFNIYFKENNRLNVSGQRFRPGLKFYINNVEIPNLENISAFFFNATFDPEALNLAPGEYKAKVENPGGKMSNEFTVVVTYRAPQVTHITPNGWNTQCNTSVRIYGSNFVPTCEVIFGLRRFKASDPANLLTFVSPSELKIDLVGNQLVAGLYQVKVANGPGAESPPLDFRILGTQETNARAIRTISPASAPADTLAEITVSRSTTTSTGALWRPGALIELNGVPQPSTCVLFSSSSTDCSTITATLDLSGIQPGNINLVVVNPCGGKSTPAPFNVLAPPDPYITGFSPAFGKVGQQFKLTVKGQSFSRNHQLKWGGQVIPTTFVSINEIVTTQDIDLTSATPGEVVIVVENSNGKKTPDIRYNILPAAATLSISSVDRTDLQKAGDYTNLKISGQGFTATTQIFFRNQIIASTFTSPALIELPRLNLAGVEAGHYYFQAKDGTTESNLFLVYVKPIPPPIIDSIDPSSVQLGISSTSISVDIFGSGLCPATSFFCSVDPLLEIINPNGVDVAPTNWSWGLPDPAWADGTLRLAGLIPGTYQFIIRNPTGERSLPGTFQVLPPPAPVATSTNPLFGFRGNASQAVNITGQNFVASDIVIFNNNVLNPIPATAPNSSTLSTTLNLSALKVAKPYPLYVLRCKDANCTTSEQSAPINFDVRNPPCCPPGDTTTTCLNNPPPACPSGEVCDATAKVCRIACTQNSECTALPFAPSTMVCQNGGCVIPTP